MIAYENKRMSEEAQNILFYYKIRTMCFCNKYSKLCTPIEKDDFDRIIENLAFIHINKGKAEPAKIG